MKELIETYARFLNPEFCPDLEFLFLASELTASVAQLKRQLEEPEQIRLDEVLEQIIYRAEKLDDEYLLFVQETQSVKTQGKFNFRNPYAPPVKANKRSRSTRTTTKETHEPKHIGAVIGLAMSQLSYKYDHPHQYQEACENIKRAFGHDLEATISGITLPWHKTLLLRANTLHTMAEETQHRYQRKQYAIDIGKMTDEIAEMCSFRGTTPDVRSARHLRRILDILYTHTLETTQEL